jgi:leucyl/phenylalanyl-tRNA--protein transferase
MPSLFPPVEYAGDDGVVAVGGNLAIETLREAYTHGIFPWPVEGWPLLWFAPPQRAVIFFDEVHVGRRLRRFLKGCNYEARFDTAFDAVIRACAGPRADEEGTWIIPELLDAYTSLHCHGAAFGIRARSVETWCEGELVGGLYGVQIGNYFCGESMFHRADNASKFAFLALVEDLQTKGSTWLDIQMLTPHFEALGAREIPREKFSLMLKQTLPSFVHDVE